MDNICDAPRCKRPGAFIYYGRDVCQRCWNRYQAEDQPPLLLKKILKVTPDEEPENIRNQKEMIEDEPKREVGD